MANFPSVTAAGAFESTAVQATVRSLARTELTSDLNGKAPTAHTHAVADVTGLAATLAALQPGNSGLRDVTALFGITTGSVHLHVWRGWCWLNFNAVILNDGGNLTLTGGGLATVAPQAPVTEAQGNINATGGTVRRVDISAAGRVRVLGATAGEQINGSVVWPFTRPIPSMWPGSATT